MPIIKPIRGTVHYIEGHPLGPAGGLKMHLLLNEGSGKKVFDLVSGNTGILQGTAPSWTSGKFGSAVLVPGTDEYIDISILPFDYLFPSNIPRNVTVSIWFLITTAQTTKGMLSIANVPLDGNPALLFQIGTTTVKVYTRATADYFYTSPSLQVKTFHNLIFVNNGVNDLVYLDGVNVYEGEDGTDTESSPEVLFLGNGFNGYFNGLIDLPMIYNRPLSASEVTELSAKPFGMLERRTRITYSFAVTEVKLLAGIVSAQSTVGAKLQEISSLSGSIDAQAVLTAKLRDLSSLSGSIDAQSSVSADLTKTVSYLLSGTIAAQSEVSANLIQIHGEIPPFMHKDLIDPYSGGAWLWLAKIVVPTQTTQRIAKNTEDVRYGGKDFIKSNFELGAQKLSGDAGIPRIVLRVAQDNDRTLENIVNATKGCEGGTVTIIRTCEKYLNDTVQALQSDYDILTAGSDSAFVTFVLGMPNPLLQRIPLWSYSSKACELATPSLFKGVRCQYPGGDATCTGLFEDCFTKGNIVHWGAEIGLDPNAVRV